MNIIDIEYSLNNGPAQSSGSRGFPINIDGDAGTTYAVRVRVVTDIGTSEWSNTVSGTPIEVSRLAPVIINIDPLNQSGNVYWQYAPGKAVVNDVIGLGDSAIVLVGLLSSGNLPVTSWEYIIKGVNNDWVSYTGEEGRVVPTGLNEDTVYEIKVRAVNSMGTGFESDYYEFNTGSGQPAIEGGDSVYDINQGGVSYRVHEFTSSGSLQVMGDGEYEMLLVAGGGGGGFARGGGGGGGGVLRLTQTISPGTYNVVVGNGGTRSVDVDQTATKGGDTSFNNNTAVGGGYGATHFDHGGDGGNGGGSGQTADSKAGKGILGQGSNGEEGTNFYGKRGGGSQNPTNVTFRVAGRIDNITGQDVEYGRGGEPNLADGGTASGIGFGGNGCNGWSSGGGQNGSKGKFIIRYRSQ